MYDDYDEDERPERPYVATWTVELTATSPTHAALLARAEFEAKSGKVALEVADTTGSTPVNLDRINPWKLIAAIREMMLEEDVNGNDFYEAVGGLFDAAGIKAD